MQGQGGRTLTLWELSRTFAGCGVFGVNLEGTAKVHGACGGRTVGGTTDGITPQPAAKRCGGQFSVGVCYAWPRSTERNKEEVAGGQKSRCGELLRTLVHLL